MSRESNLVIYNATQRDNDIFLCIGRTFKNYLFRGEAELKVFGKCPPQTKFKSSVK